MGNEFTVQLDVDTRPGPGQVAFSLVVVGNVNIDSADVLRQEITATLEALQAVAFDPEPESASRIPYTNLDLIGIRFETAPGMRVEPLPTEQKPLSLPLNDPQHADCGRPECYLCGPRQGAGVAKLISGLPRGEDAGMGTSKPHPLDRNDA